MLYILTENITNFDFILTWGKYYENFNEEKDIYNYIIEIIDNLLLEIIAGQNKAIVTLSGKMSLNDPQIQSTLYYLNISLEFITFYNLKYNNSFFQRDIEEINKIIKNDLKYILYSKKLPNIEHLSPIEELYNNDIKIKNYSFITFILSCFYPIWLGEEKKFLNNENDLFFKLMFSINQNKFINELEFLMYSFDKKFFKNNGENICNKGIKMSNLLYILFTSILNIGGDERELNNYFRDFRNFISVLIMSPPTINLAESIKKKRWPNEYQYEEINRTVHNILFNSTYFLYNKLKNLKEQEKNYNSKLENMNESDKKNIQCILILKRIYMENFGYILKILNQIYTSIKEEDKHKGMNIFKGNNTMIKNIKKSGAYSFIDELYNECLNNEMKNKEISDNLRINNYLDNIMKINFKSENDKEIIYLSDDNFKKLEKNIELFLNDEYIQTYYNNNLNQHLTKLYSFLPIIQKRLEKIKTIIPVYNNRKNISNNSNELLSVSNNNP